MSSHDIVVAANHIEHLAVARPKDHLLWEKIEDDADGRHALIIGSLDDALIVPGTLSQLATLADLITGRVKVEQERVDAKAKRKAAKREQRKAAAAKAAEPVTLAAKEPGFITMFLRPGAELLAGGVVPEGTYGVRLSGGVDLLGSKHAFGTMGDLLASQFLSKRAELVAVAADMMQSASQGSAWEGFTCIEVDAIARMLVAHGYFSEAADIISAHANEDDPHEQHGYIRTLSGDDREEAAMVFVRRLGGEVGAMPVNAAAKRDALAYHEEHVRQLRLELGQPAEL